MMNWPASVCCKKLLKEPNSSSSVLARHISLCLATDGPRNTETVAVVWLTLSWTDIWRLGIHTDTRTNVQTAGDRMGAWTDIHTDCMAGTQELPQVSVANYRPYRYGLLHNNTARTPTGVG